MATSKAMPPPHSSSAAASASESVRSELERVGPGERNRLHTKKARCASLACPAAAYVGGGG